MIPESPSPIWAYGALCNHLWQSTLFLGIVALLALLFRKNRARIRYRLWMAASAKFLIPFSLLVSLGSHLPWPSHAVAPKTSAYFAIEEMNQPFLEGTPRNPPIAIPVAQPAASHVPIRILPNMLTMVWLGGFLAMMSFWCVQWRRISKLVRSARPLTEGREIDLLRKAERVTKLARSVPLLASSNSMEPGVVGLIRPVLLWPEGIARHMDDAHLESVLAHEVCHVQRRDNLTSAIHMLVEAIFWFHPVVWWMEKQLVKERERACDEAVLHLGNEAAVYAESILDVCKFYTESPFACMSGVTGSELKQRIARIMSGQGVRNLDLRRKAMLALACVVVVGVPLAMGFLRAANGQTQRAQSNAVEKGGITGQAAVAETGIEGTWQGTLHYPHKDMRTVVKLSKAPDRSLKAILYSIDQEGQAVTASIVIFDGHHLRFEIDLAAGAYEGELSADRNSILGTWTQASQSMSLVFERASSKTEWAIPEQPSALKPMPSDASPGFEVATIKPSKTDRYGQGLSLRGDRLFMVGSTLNDFIKYAYDLQDKQIIGAQPWMNIDRFDIVAQPDVPGVPSPPQLKTMLKKLLAERFQLAVHTDEHDLPAYALRTARGGPKLTQNQGDPNGLPGLLFSGPGSLTVRNATMDDFCHLMESEVLERPVVNQTGIDGRWNFVLRWIPDASQFGGMWAKLPPPMSPNAPPPLFTAISEQIGLKFEATKAKLIVIVIDRADHPSPN